MRLLPSLAVTNLITHRFPLEDAPAAYALIDSAIPRPSA